MPSAWLTALSCGGVTPVRDGGPPPALDGGPAGRGDYVLLAWNDLGMHCLNPTYDQAVLLPPYNTLWAQVVRRGNPPQVITSGVAVEYRILDNTYSYGKRGYGGFWDNAQALFGQSLPRDRGLNLAEPNRHNGLSGSMGVAQGGDHFEVHGIPVTPVDDRGAWNPYQVAEITLKDAAGSVLARTRATVPTSDEIHCGRCHGASPLADVLQKHDRFHGTHLAASAPVLCASCHGSPALGVSGPGSSGKYLSQAIHSFHASRDAACYDCHPGATTQCSRSLAHTGPDGFCVTCHGSLGEVGGSIARGARIPWADEPKCATCHAGVAQVDTASTLYRQARGHGGLYCPACHGSPHAMVPTRTDSDNYQALQYQGWAVVIGSCRACHTRSRGPGDGGVLGDFAEEHVGPTPRVSVACHVCHTAISTDTSRWPHSFQWKDRQ